MSISMSTPLAFDDSDFENYPLPPTSATKTKGKTVCTRKFSKYENAILRNVWLLDPFYLNLLDSNTTYITKIGHFLGDCEEEKFPATYQDVYLKPGSNRYYFVSYFFCSGQYLDDLAERDPERLVVFQLRKNEANKMRICLVRLWKEEWNLEMMIQSGAVDLRSKERSE